MGPQAHQQCHSTLASAQPRIGDASGDGLRRGEATQMARDLSVQLVQVLWGIPIGCVQWRVLHRRDWPMSIVMYITNQ